MKKLILSICLLVTSCTWHVIEKQTEPVSQAVYATKDSIDAARIDLADTYINQATRLIAPPKNRITITSIYKEAPKSQTPVVANNKLTETKSRVVIVPEQYKNQHVVVVGTEEYDLLRKDAETAKQLQDDLRNAMENNESITQELQNQKRIHDELLARYTAIQVDYEKVKNTLLKRNVFIGILLLINGVYIFIRIRGLIPV